MGIKQERVIARADMNDEFGVSVWQEKKLKEYSIEEAYALADEISRAADEATRVRLEDDELQASTEDFPHVLTDADLGHI